MEHRVVKTGYLLARGYVVAWGVFLMFGMFASQLVMPGLYYDTGPAPPWQDRIVEVSAVIGYAVLLVLPYRWSIRGWLFGIRLALLFLASLLMAFMAVSTIYDFMEGSQKHWLIVPLSVLVLALAVLAPGALLARRKWIDG